MIIDLNDLRHSINRALTLGRYQIVVKTAGAEQVPASITLDLLERDDDGFKFRVDPEYSEHPVYEQMRAVKGERQRAAMVWHALQLYAHETEAPFPKSTLDWFAQRVGVRLTRSDAVPSDDHGAAIPEQAESLVKGQFSEPRVYEFALQDAVFIGPNAKLQDVVTGNCPDLKAYAAADWVHVYDRVTRERRTLKRPEPDVVLTGLRDVADDLRGKTDDAMHRAAVEAGYADLGAYVEAQTPAADPMPPVGPLTSTEGLKAGDVLRVVFAAKHGGMLGFEDGALATFTQPNGPKGLGSMMSDGEEHWWDVDRFAFVARPGVWMPWEGGENPVPGLRVKVKNTYGREVDEPEPRPSERVAFSGPAACSAFMVVDTPPASSDT